MTYSAVPALRVDPAIAAEWEPRLIDGRAVRDGDDREAGRLGRARQHHPRRAGRRRLVRARTATSGSAPIRRATSSSCSPRRPRASRASCVERGAGMEFQRLKDKLGTRSLPSSEVEFHGAAARLLGEEGRGVATIIEMVTHTRLDCVIGSAAGDAPRRRRGDLARAPPLRLRRAAGRAARDGQRARRPGAGVRGRDRDRAAARARLRRGRPRVRAASPPRSRSTGSASGRRRTRSRRWSASAATATSRSRRCRGCCATRR